MRSMRLSVSMDRISARSSENSLNYWCTIGHLEVGEWDVNRCMWNLLYYETTNKRRRRQNYSYFMVYFLYSFQSMWRLYFNVLFLFLETNHLDCFLHKHFLSVSQGEEYLALSIDDLVTILNRDELFVESEEQMFDACMRWVQHNPERKQYLPR